MQNQNIASERESKLNFNSYKVDYKKYSSLKKEMTTIIIDVLKETIYG